MKHEKLTIEALSAYRDQTFDALKTLVDQCPPGPSDLRSVFVTQLLLFAAGAYREGAPHSNGTGFAGMAFDLFHRIAQEKPTLLDPAGLEEKTGLHAIEICRVFALMPRGDIAAEVAHVPDATVEGYAMLLMAVAQTIAGVMQKPGEDERATLARVITAFLALAPGEDSKVEWQRGGFHD